jgi:hypothetical protein
MKRGIQIAFIEGEVIRFCDDINALEMRNGPFLTVLHHRDRVTLSWPAERVHSVVAIEAQTEEEVWALIDTKSPEPEGNAA